ncbi:putative membrane protein YphA (DoxX/SURF4 family) [Salirhabdus euzebyi]|uniref:Putative membrane protein YphA (DoxX/SURF4 family) n=1 Tax=Salirhabdus euzebyi TaxID=394506 RepID=A0A841Q8X2_9BACI|nr:DoxX family protein [Salirhabdus euzebyi]MBB6454921.1 putative membrane protein YphA (DoxX/SURF4 family) [Salirhabdus euzebyi]
MYFQSLSTFKLLRYAVAYVFICSGIMKLVSENLGTFFISLGLPFPLQLMVIVAIVEIACGVLLLLEKSVSYATIPLIVIMITAFLLTKVPVLHTGFLPFAFEARLDIVMLILLFILFSHYHKK